jgi:sarcosine oxidase subunit beta
MSDRRVVIIGAGVGGLSCAVQLAELGEADITVLEQSHVAAASSSLSVGMFTRNYIDPLDIGLRLWSHQFIARLERDHQLPVKRIGYLRIARSTKAMEVLTAASQTQRSLGVTDTSVLDADQIAHRFPHLSMDDRVGGVFVADDGYLDGTVLSNVYLQLAVDAGVRYQGRSEVTGIDTAGSGFVVHTARGDVEADVVVNAAGSWANRVAKMVGDDLGILPQRHQAAVLRLSQPLGYVMPNVMDYVPGVDEAGAYLRHESDFQLVAGVHTNEVERGANDDPDHFDERGDQAFIEQLADGLDRLLLGAGDVGIETTWAGLYPMSPDGQMLLGPTRVEGMYACAGLGGIGIHVSPAAGRLVAESIVHGDFSLVPGAERLLANRAIFVDQS